MGIATLLIAMRLWVRGRITRKVGWDDILITLALVSDVAIVILNAVIENISTCKLSVK